MKQKLPGGVIVAVLALVAACIAFFGYRTVTGGPNGDVTQESIKHWQSVRAQENSQKPSSAADAAKVGAPMSGGAPSSASRYGAPMSGPPTAGHSPMGAPMGAPSGGPPAGAPMGAPSGGPPR